MRLAELAQRAGEFDYSAAGAAVSRFARRVREEPSLSRHVRRIERELSKVEMWPQNNYPAHRERIVEGRDVTPK
jgi:hypothetical protein